MSIPNLTLPEKAVDEAIEELTRQDFSPPAFQHNQEFYGYIRSDIPVSYRDTKVQLRHAFARVPAQRTRVIGVVRVEGPVTQLICSPSQMPSLTQTERCTLGVANSTDNNGPV